MDTNAPSKIEYLINVPLQVEQVIALFQSSGLRRPVDQPERIQRMIEFANLTFTAWDGEKLVGIARALTDYGFCCYLSDLAVDGAYQRQGIGKELIRLMREHLGEEVMLLLLSAPKAMSYYPHVGFENINNAWLIRRRR
ncbi:MAG: GNAT family N-acetyltransferase [Chloroflexi bacterium]|nr:GNAT family N-acetyltransferase [Chloroflexota bacterium]